MHDCDFRYLRGGNQTPSDPLALRVQQDVSEMFSRQPDSRYDLKCNWGDVVFARDRLMAVKKNLLKISIDSSFEDITTFRMAAIESRMDGIESKNERRSNETQTQIYDIYKRLRDLEEERRERDRAAARADAAERKDRLLEENTRKRDLKAQQAHRRACVNPFSQKQSEWEEEDFADVDQSPQMFGKPNKSSSFHWTNSNKTSAKKYAVTAPQIKSNSALEEV